MSIVAEERDLLAALVAAAGGPDDLDAIETVNRILERWFRGLGFTVHRRPVPGRADLLVAEAQVGNTMAGDGVGTAVTIVGHSDTVWPVGFDSAWQYGEDAETGMLTGPGVGDMKAGIVLAGIAAHRAVRASQGPGTIRLLIVPDEEAGSVGTRPWLEQYAEHTDLCIGIEAGKPGDGFVGSRGAVGAMRVAATGRAVHVTEPGGINAATPLVSLAASVQALSTPSVLVSVCHLDIGSSRQIAAERGLFEVDVRADRDADLEDAVSQIQAAVARADETFEGSIEVSGGLTRPAYPSSVSEEAWRVLRELDGRLARGSTAYRVHERGGSDTSFFAAAGVPSLDGFGAVCWNNCARDEQVSSASLDDRAERMAALITTWIDGGYRRSHADRRR